MNLIRELTENFDLQTWQVENTLKLIDEGNTIPFIARYRKERTGSLDDQLLRKFSQKLDSLRAIEQRKEEVIRLIKQQNKMTEELRVKIEGALSLSEIDDLYRPYRPKRKTRGTVARARGLEPLASMIKSSETIMSQLKNQASALASASQELESADEAIEGACDIIAEQLSDNANLRTSLRQLLYKQGVLVCKAVKSYKDERDVYAMYGDYQENITRMPGHRILAVNRGEKEKALTVKLVIDESHVMPKLLTGLPGPDSEMYQLIQTVSLDAWKRLLLPSLSTEARRQMTEKAEEGAMEVFADNLQSLLMQPPIRDKIVLGIDPGYRTGCKFALVNQTGRVLDTGVIYPTPPHNQYEQAGKTIVEKLKSHQVSLIAIGNGTASRETEQFISQLMKTYQPRVPYLVVSESGASVYSASPAAAEEFPDFDVSLRSAVSIARRVQDPLAELVKIEPRSIGVGQYQHDMSQKRLSDVLGGVVESCVNQVGVDLNTASAALLNYIAGLNTTLAKNIISFREKTGKFNNRKELLQVSRMGPKAFEQCAGFLRIAGGSELLDNTSVHPESYKQVYNLSQLLQCDPSPELAIKAKETGIKTLAEKSGLGIPTLEDIIEALVKPGRDPRDDLPQPVLRSDVMEMADLKPEMILQGVVRNVADFGAFVDIGVHQDGLVHISELADHFVRRPMDVVKIGQSVKVKILHVDEARKRISLSMKNIKQPSVN